MDFIEAYDFVNSHSKETGHHAQLSTGRTPHQRSEGDQSCEIAVEHLKIHGVSPNKILLGIPLFGRSFLGADGPNQPFADVGGTNGVHEVRNLRKHNLKHVFFSWRGDYKLTYDKARPGTTEIFEEDACAVWCASTNEYVSYDNDESVFEKAWFVKDFGLAGLFFFHLGYDRAGERSLVRKGWDTLNEFRAGHS